MAQPTITTFYQNKKKNLDLQPSKRRKLRHTVEENSELIPSDVGQLFQPDPPSCYTKRRSKISALSENISIQSELLESDVPSATETIKTSGKTKTTRKTRSTRAKKAADVTVTDKSVERVAAVIDNHVVSTPTPPTSPSKRISSEDSQKEVTRKRGRKNQQTRVDHLMNKQNAIENSSVEDGYAFNLFTAEPEKAAQSKSRRKKLVLSPKSSKADREISTPSDDVDGPETADLEESKVELKEIILDVKKPSTKEKKVRKTREKCKTPEPIEIEQSDEQIQSTIKPSSSSSKNKTSENLMKETDVQSSHEPSSTNQVPDSKTNKKTKSIATPMMDKVMMKLKSRVMKTAETANSQQVEETETEIKTLPNAAAMKAKLQKCGKLADLQEQLALMNKDVRKVKDARKKVEEAAVKVGKLESEAKPSKSDETAPAYERFHSLAQPVPPTLSLPYKYKLLSEMFRTADTVVSMLHNRHEVCTFNKLKSAVQEMLRKTFKTRNLGQIKEVYSTAYKYRQERNIPNMCGRSSDYQLTVEPVLDGSCPDDTTKSSKHESFQASTLVARKHVFHSKLIDIVKRHHREFLSTLERPLSVPDDKLTRWHPKFPLDQLPDIEPAHLPEPPYAEKTVTAKDVLKTASDKYNEKVRQALQNVANNNSNSSTSTVESNAGNAGNAGNASNASTVNKPNKPDKQLAGVSQSLLERIRAKEAKHVALSMVMSPADERRQLMMSRLPALTRTLRSIFVTEKKPALPLDDCLKKLADSYTSSISTGEVEKHLSLMLEILPDWVQVVKTHKGKFVKLDKNRDLSAVHARIHKQMATERLA